MITLMTILREKEERATAKFLHQEGREQKQEELQSYSLWNKNHIHRKTDKMKGRGLCTR